ncbi:class I SAM-dependent methyltransferase [Actinopolymorpha alba]|uniref:class I SAM-dependent methyltransferase n=1 Tax=Actinopolymorpha alba TaxID=533267 RepID=UPI00037A0814|nr:class I SAM-dependent methyltransferase [Actinopolymorpha alba]
MPDTNAQPDFNHNDFYHRYLLRQVPRQCDRALDIGCGTGLFARRLAQRAQTVEAIDRAPEVIAQARALSHDTPNVRYAEADLADYDLGTARYDFISGLASVHHMPFAETITKLRDALTPGGVLAILGLCRYATRADYLPDLVAAPANLAAKAVVRAKARFGSRVAGSGPAPSMNAQMTLPEIRTEAARLLPGAVIRRRVFWRYSLIYRQPATSTR